MSADKVAVQDALDKIVPEGHHYRHLDEGLDDMPAHVKVPALVNDHGKPCWECSHCDSAFCVWVVALQKPLPICALPCAEVDIICACSPRSWARA